MTTLTTKTEIEYFQLASLKGALKLESKGLTHSGMRGKKLRPLWAETLGLKPRDSYERYIEVIQGKMDEMVKANHETEQQ